MKKAKNIFFVILLLFIQACQSSPDESPSETTEPATKKSNSMILDEDNYIKISRYNYSRFSALKQQKHLPANSKKRSYPGENRVVVVKNLLQVSTGSNENPNKDVMNIKQNGITVVVEVDKSEKLVTISYDDGKKSLKEDMTLEEFQNLGRGEML